MKLSNDTINVLKNFSTINPSIMFKEGSELKTISPSRSVLGRAKLSEEFDRNAGVYNLSRFLSTISLFEDPEIELDDDHFLIKSGRKKLKYYYTSENMILTPPDKDIPLNDVKAEVDISWDDISSVTKAAGLLDLPEVAFVCQDGDISFVAVDNTKNISRDTFSSSIASVEDVEDFQIVISTENLKLIPKDYNVKLTEQVAKFSSDNVDYWVAVETR